MVRRLSWIPKSFLRNFVAGCTEDSFPCSDLRYHCQQTDILGGCWTNDWIVLANALCEVCCDRHKYRKIKSLKQILPIAITEWQKVLIKSLLFEMYSYANRNVINITCLFNFSLKHMQQNTLTSCVILRKKRLPKHEFIDIYNIVLNYLIWYTWSFECWNILIRKLHPKNIYN